MRGDAVFFYRLVVRAGAVPFVFLETVCWELFCERNHALVAHDFCNDGCERNHELFFITLYDCLLIWIVCRRAKTAVEEDRGTN